MIVIIIVIIITMIIVIVMVTMRSRTETCDRRGKQPVFMLVAFPSKKVEILLHDILSHPLVIFPSKKVKFIIYTEDNLAMMSLSSLLPLLLPMLIAIAIPYP